MHTQNFYWGGIGADSEAMYYLRSILKTVTKIMSKFPGPTSS